MIINLVGPPAAGKSTFAARFVLEHPEYKFCSIDSYRQKYEDEDLAWYYILQDVMNQRNVIIETIGLGYKLKELFNNETVRRRPLLTIALVGLRDQMRRRLSERQERQGPQPWHIAETATIDYVLFNLDGKSVAPIDNTIDTTFRTKEQVYKDICILIADARIETFGQRKRRQEDFLRGVYDPMEKKYGSSNQ